MNRPHRSSWGKITAGDELDGLELGGREGGDEEAECGAEQGVEEGDQQEEPGGAGDVEAEAPQGEGRRQYGLDDREGAEGEGVTGDEVALAEGHGEEAFEGARGAFAQGGDGRDQEHRDEREDTEERGADGVEGAGAAVEDVAEQEEHHARDEQHQGDGARVVAELAQDSGCGGEGAGCVHRGLRWRVLAWSTRWRKASSTVAAPVLSSQGVGAVVGEDLAFAHEEEAVAALGLVHDVRGDEKRGAALGGDGVEEVPQVAAQDGVEADGGFVEDQEFGVPRRATASETRLSWPPERLPASASAWDVRSTSEMTRATSSRRWEAAARPGWSTAEK